LLRLQDSVSNLKGIGIQRLKLLGQLGIFTIEDLISYFPRNYEDWSQTTSIKDVSIGEIHTIQGKISTIPQNIKKGKLVMTKMKIQDSTGTLWIVWYGQPYLKNYFHKGETYLFTGKVNYYYGSLQLLSPEYEKINNTQKDSDIGILPIYSLPKKLSQKLFRNWIKEALEKIESTIQEFIPLWIRKQYELADLEYSIYHIHFPKDRQHFLTARRRLVFEEFFLLQLGLLQIKQTVDKKLEGISFKPVEEVKTFIKQLPFCLTDGQKKVMEEIQQDMYSTYAMNRLVQGDVGSGKTIVAAIALLITAKNGYQGSMMAPTEVLALQHYETLKTLLDPFGVTCTLLVGSLTKKQKENIWENIKNQKIDIVIGTHALIQESVSFKKLGLVITDEQHRFGVRQRISLSQKGESPDVLVMTATPIPRTLALILYGDLDISIIDELPPGRQQIKTYAVPSSYRNRIYLFMKKEIEKGRQVYMICPMVEESETLELESVIKYTEKLKKEIFPHYNIAYLHGKMKPKEKNEIMEEFSQGRIQVLVSTTVVEVGINVPNATLMVIENAERFGLSQLHQLRGRVGRGKHQSYCILISDAKNKIALERMKVMTDTTDGFKISEMDLKLRGPGDFFGTKQHGLPDLKIANLYEDMVILKQAQEAILALFEKDPFLQQTEHCFLKKKINELFKNSTEVLAL